MKSYNHLYEKNNIRNEPTVRSVSSKAQQEIP